MALLPCTECQKDVSDKASTCPHCGMPLRAASGAPSPDRRRRPATLGGAVILALAAGAAIFAARRGPDYALVDALRAEQDDRGGTHNEHVRQRTFRLYKDHPHDAMYTYLWSRCVDDVGKQLELAEEGMRADPRFAWNYNTAARVHARLGRVPQAYDLATRGASLDPANMQLLDKVEVLKLMIDHQLAAQPRPAPGAVKYKGIFHGAIHAPDRLDLQAIEKSRTPETKGPLAEAVRGVLVCANTFADACLRTFVPVDGKFGKAWAASGADVTSLKDHQVVTVSGTAVANGKGESLLLADSVTVEGH